MPDPSPHATRSVAQLRRLLRNWYRAHRRDLPWRETRDPYAIWVSEVMLQQTQVATVIPFFLRFLAAFPNVAALAAADEHEVLRQWEGLGYYRRARCLHRAAKAVVERHGGRIPDDPDALQKLPGFGRYTVGAVLSQAYDRPLPILEANSLRVLCRLFAVDGDPRSGAVRRRLWELAEALVPQRGAGEFNQALMEIGALVCTSAAPRCTACPLKRTCAAFQTGRQGELPARPPSAQVVEVREVAVVVRRRAAVFLVRRPESGRWAGLWEFPHGPLEDGERPEEAATRLLTSVTGLSATIGREIGVLRHGVTRYRITLACFEARYRRGAFRSDFYTAGRWVVPAQLADFALSAPQRRLARLLVEPACPPLF